MKQELCLFTYLYQAQSIKSLRRYTNETPESRSSVRLLISTPEAQYVSLYLLQKLSTSPYIYSKAQYIYSTPDLYQDWSQWTPNIAWIYFP